MRVWELAPRLRLVCSKTPPSPPPPRAPDATRPCSCLLQALRRTRACGLSWEQICAMEGGAGGVLWEGGPISTKTVRRPHPSSQHCQWQGQKGNRW